MNTKNQEWKEHAKIAPKMNYAAELAVAVLIAAAFVGILILGSCGTLDEQYVEADRATFNSLEPWIRTNADPVADESKILVLDSWKLRLETAEGAK